MQPFFCVQNREISNQMNQIQNPNVTNVQTSLFCNNAVSRTSFSYNGNNVEFRLTENVMLNATQMAKPFGKKAINWLRLPSTKAFLLALVQSKARCENLTLKNQSEATQINSVYHSYYGGLVIGQHGGANPGTWMHEDVAIEFARWLNPKFAIWCNDRIKEILRGGKPLPVPAKQPKAPAKALAQQVTIDGMPIVEYMRIKTKSIADNVKKTTELYSQNIGAPGIMQFTWSDSSTVEQNVKNFMALANNNIVTATRLYYESERKNRMYKNMHSDLQQIVNMLYDKYNILPQ
jgi:hypothetical protein